MRVAKTRETRLVVRRVYRYVRRRSDRTRRRRLLDAQKSDVAILRRLLGVRLGARERAERDQHTLRRVRVFRVRVLLARDRAEQIQRLARLLRRVAQARGNHNELASGAVRGETRFGRRGGRRPSLGGRGARGWARGEETRHHFGLRTSRFRALRGWWVEVSGCARRPASEPRDARSEIRRERRERGTPESAVARGRRTHLR